MIPTANGSVVTKVALLGRATFLLSEKLEFVVQQEMKYLEVNAKPLFEISGAGSSKSALRRTQTSTDYTVYAERAGKVNGLEPESA